MKMMVVTVKEMIVKVAWGAEDGENGCDVS